MSAYFDQRQDDFITGLERALQILSARLFTARQKLAAAERGPFAFFRGRRRAELQAAHDALAAAHRDICQVLGSDTPMALGGAQAARAARLRRKTESHAHSELANAD